MATLCLMMPESVMVGPTVRPAVRVVRECVALIHMGPDEYGNEKMAQVAADWFEANPAARFVEVYEHAGWYLGFRRDGTIWCTANDAACCTGPMPPRDYVLSPCIQR